MTTIAGGVFMPTAPPPRSGILLNASPASSVPNSPKRSSFLTPCLSGGTTLGLRQIPVSSHSSTSSTASSTDDIVSSTSATSAAGTHVSTSSIKAQYSQLRIRFAPLPEPRRDDYDVEELLSPAYFETDSAAASPNMAAQSLLSPPISPNVLLSTLQHSPNLNGSHGQTSCSTLGLALDGVELPTDSGQATETNTVAGSECGTDDTHTAANLKKKSTRWSRLIPFAKPPSLKSGPRTPDEHHYGLCRSPSRESTASGYSFRSATGLGRLLGSVSDNGSSASLGNTVPRRKTVSGADSVPVSPSVSFRGGHSLKPVVSEAGTAATAAPRRKGHAQTNSSPNVRRGTRLLNGRVYGRRPQSAGGVSRNPFDNIRDEEPEFVEWGNGGMGSVRTADLGSSQWARLQSSKKVSVGHDDGTVAGDEDDGSGMTWVKKRREARERERKEREEREAKEKAEMKRNVGDDEVRPPVEPSASEVAIDRGEVERTGVDVAKSVSELGSSEASALVPSAVVADKELRDTPSDGDRTADEEAKTKEEADYRKEKEYVYTAVTIPASRLRHQSHSRQNSLNASILPSATRSAVHTPSQNTPTTEVPPVQHMFFVTSPLGSPGATVAALGPTPLSLGTKHAGETTSTPSSSASSSYEEESPLGDRDEKDDVDEEEEEEANTQARKTSIGAGVEKISRHKD